MMRRGYRERTDELAQGVIDAWNASGTKFTAEFGALLHKAFLYKTARQKAENHRAFDILSSRDEDEERAAALDICASAQDLLQKASSKI